MQQLQKLHCSIAIDKNNFMTTGGRFIIMNSHINGDTPFLTNQITNTILKFNLFYNKSFKKNMCKFEIVIVLKKIKKTQINNLDGSV